jgi:hypothetical protein
MPPKGWRRPRTLTADDYAISLRFMESVVQMANGLAQLHPNLPRMSVLLTIAEDAQKELAVAVAAARRHETADGSDLRRTDPPLPTQELGSSAER